MRRLALLIAAGTLWLFLAAVPAFADGGPHVASKNDGTTSLTADTCAGCHRAHSATGQYLLAAGTTEEELCLSCHGATGTGAATDVMTGVQYVKGTISGPDKSDDPILGYLRNGGFDQAHLGTDNGVRVTYYRTATDLSNRPKIPAEATAENVTSAHLDLDGVSGVTAKHTIWGNGAALQAAPIVEMECGGCHNVHGNGQYRILQKFDQSGQLVQQITTVVTSVSDTTDRFLTTTPHGFITGDLVKFSGAVPAEVNTTSVYIVKSVPSALQFTVALAANAKTSDITASAVDILAADTDDFNVARYASIVDDATAPASTDNRNYTILQVKGTQGTESSYMLYESDVLDARLPTPTKTWPAGDYSTIGGDYFHRTVPWNPAVVAPGDETCNTTYVSPTPTKCQTSTDAPNGRPATYTPTGSSQMLQPHVGFNEQMSVWCATCHTRYMGNNPVPPTDTSAPSSTQVAKSITAVDADLDTITRASTGSTDTYSVGDRVQFTGGPAPLVNGTTYFVVSYASNAMKVSTTFDGPILNITGTTTGGTVLRVASVSASPWWYPRTGEYQVTAGKPEALANAQYMYQHSTTGNRGCVVCHVGHGSDAQNTLGGLSDGVQYPDGDGTWTAPTAGFNSRLLKVDNRGTCQMCHEPTTTVEAGDYVPTGTTAGTFPATAP